MIFFNSNERVRVLTKSRSTVVKRLRRGYRKQWLRKHELYMRRKIYRKNRPSVYQPSTRRMPVIAFDRMWGYENVPILIKRKKLWVYARPTPLVSPLMRQISYRFWRHSKSPARNPV